MCFRVSYSKDDTIMQNGVNTGFTLVTGLDEFTQCSYVSFTSPIGNESDAVTI